MPLVLGARPEVLTVVLTRGADFIATLSNRNGPWDPAAVITLVFATDPETTWTATITDASATFNVDKALADTIPARTDVELRYTLGDVDQVWARGRVARSD